MIIKTETGSEYYLRSGILTKKGDNLMAYKTYNVIPFEHGTTKSIEDILKLPQGKPEIGKRVYFSGLGEWNVTTNVVEIIEEDEDD